MTEGLSDLFLTFKRDAVLEIVERRLGAGEDPLRILDDCRRGMTLVGERFQEGDFFLAELMLSAEIFKEVTAIIEPRLFQAKPAQTRGRVLIGTLQGDIHELGKNILITMLRAHGFEVHDLGVDVPPSAVAEKVKEFQPHVVGFSALITTAFLSMKEAVALLQEAGLRDSVKVMIGGGVTTAGVRDYVGADFQTTDAIEGVSYCLKITGGK
jgi:methylmalonyl-CoA mutase cobalamin-binding domain/chain